MRARAVMTRKRFRKWLKSKRPLSIVGSPSKYGMNPLANYLRENGYPEADLGVLIWCPDHDSEISYWLPDWAEYFISDVDLTELKRITAKRALAILEAI